MGFFNKLWEHTHQPGPGVEADEPRKKGLLRLWEVCTRDLSGFFWAGLLALLGLAPWLVLVGLMQAVGALVPVVLAGALGGLIAAPELCALSDLLLRGLRDEPFYWWSTWRKAWKGSLRACLLPGALLGLLVALDLWAAQAFLAGQMGQGGLWAVFVGLLLVAGLFPYLCAQLVLFDQSLGRTLKNSVLLFLASLPRSLGAAAILLGYLALISLFAPASYVVAVLGNVWLPLAAAFLMIYQPMEKNLDLENQVHAAQEARRSGS